MLWSIYLSLVFLLCKFKTSKFLVQSDFHWLFTLCDFIVWFQDAEAAAQDDVERVLKVTAEYKQRWNQAWEDQEKRLKQNLQICQFNYDLRQVSVWTKVSFTLLYILFGHVVLERYSTRWSICIQAAGLRSSLKLLYIDRLKSLEKEMQKKKKIISLSLISLTWNFSSFFRYYLRFRFKSKIFCEPGTRDDILISLFWISDPLWNRWATSASTGQTR